MEWLLDLLSNLFCCDDAPYLMAFNILSSMEKFVEQMRQETATVREYKAFAGSDSSMLQYTKPYLDKYNIPVYSGGGDQAYHMGNPQGTDAATLKKAYLEFMNDYGLRDNMHDTSDKEYFRINPEYRTGLLEDAEYGVGSTIRDIAEMRKASSNYAADLQRQQALRNAEIEKRNKEIEKRNEEIRAQNRQLQREADEKALVEQRQLQARNALTGTTTNEVTFIDGRRRALRQQNEKHTGGSLGVKNMGMLGTMGFGGSLGSGLY